MRAKILDLMKNASLFLAMIFAWQVAFYLTTGVLRVWKPYMFPTPAGVLRTFVKLAANGSLPLAIGTSLRRVAAGFLLSICVGAPLGAALYYNKLLRGALRPAFLGLQTLPSICWMPFAILWFGLRESAILFVIVIGSAFSIALAVEAGFSQVNPAYVKAGRTLGAARHKLFIHIILPDSLPQIVAGLKQGWSFAWRALMNAEMLSATLGLGQILMFGRDLSDINQVMCVMAVIVLLGVAVDRLVFGKMEQRLRRKRGMA